MQSYRLEVAVKRVYGLDPLIASVASTISVEVRFLDFPPIVIHPQGYAIGDSVTYNICHKADFRMSTAQPPLRTYADYVIGNAAGETVGYADMSCRVLSQDAPAPRASVMPLPIAAPPVRDAEPSRETGAEQGKPYIVRVVVGESDRHRRPSQPPRCEGVQDASRGHEATAARASVSDRGQPPRRVPANTAEKSSLLHLLQYDVAYQLQSLSETVAAALHREHDVLTRTPLKGPDKSGAVSTSRLTKSIDNHVASIVRVANIILQVANQLVDNSPAPPRIGTSREVKDMIRQWRNPVNKLPLPAEGSVGHYLQYDVLYQLQCLGTNLAYMIVAYRAALDTPLSSIPAQHVEYCDELGHEIQHLTKHINILVQSSVDGTLSTAAPSIVPEPVAHDKHRKRSKGNSQSTPPAAGPQLAPPKFTGAAKSLSRTSYSSFSSTRSASSSSLSSSSLSSSLNRPPARGSPPQAPTVVTVPATPPPAVSSQQAAAPAPNATSQPLPPPPSYNAAAATTSSQQTSPPLPTQPPPPYTVAAPSAQSTATPLPTPAKSRTGLSPSNSIESFSAPTVPSQANQLVSPVSWINQESNYQSPPVATSPPSLHTALQSTGMYGTASSTFAPQPVLATGGPPVLHPPYLSSVPPPLATPTPLAPPSAAPSPPPMAAPKLATQLPIQPQSQAPLAIPIPVPIPR
ncbi:hypothetical protein CGC20_14985 [Leishmania donovani]|uniref:Uncharacterized protein n=1 Tax=Leishmania donovani TaxID=5661 RepID=A0A504XHJ0_LEIDO|nr:hypothetical protein CGC20_14985 [Leishmania donovani]